MSIYLILVMTNYQLASRNGRDASHSRADPVAFRYQFVRGESQLERAESVHIVGKTGFDGYCEGERMMRFLLMEI